MGKGLAVFVTLAVVIAPFGRSTLAETLGASDFTKPANAAIAIVGRLEDIAVFVGFAFVGAIFGFAGDLCATDCTFVAHTRVATVFGRKGDGVFVIFPFVGTAWRFTSFGCAHHLAVFALASVAIFGRNRVTCLVSFTVLLAGFPTRRVSTTATSQDPPAATEHQNPQPTQIPSHRIHSFSRSVNLEHTNSSL